MLLILLKGCFVQYKTGDSEEENEQLFLFHNHNRIMNSGYLESFVQTCVLVSHWHNSSNSHWHDFSTVQNYVHESLARLFNSRQHDSSTVTGTIVRQWQARFFNTHWQNSSTVTGTILQQWLAQFSNSHGQDFFFFLWRQNPSTVMFTVEGSCHVPGTRHMIH